MATTVKHIRTIEKDEDGEYTYSCSCKTVYESRLGSHAAAARVAQAHVAAVADGSWQAEQDAEAARLAELKPLHDAIRARNTAKEELQSLGFEYMIARQSGGDVEAAKTELEAARVVLADAESALEAVKAARA